MIIRELDLSESTVKTHLQAIFRRLGVALAHPGGGGGGARYQLEPLVIWNANGASACSAASNASARKGLFTATPLPARRASSAGSVLR